MINNYKMAIIGPESIEYRGDIADDEIHLNVMKKYGLERYGNNSVFGLFDDIFTFNLAEYYLTSYQNILFYNLSSEDIKFGIICVLDNISDTQRKLVNEFLDSLDGFTIELDSFVTIDGELIMNDPFEESFDDGFIEVREYFNDIAIGDKYFK